SGEIVTSFALTEPDVGSDSGAVKTRAVRDGDVYRLSGTKRFITNADKMIADLEDAYILIHEKKLTGLQAMLPVLESVVQT
ncbi:acyl-CoA dehydrogenase family protein, partial [Morganella morganii]|uniref:acyl-CoA dehydrogenase family protein n=1 Tax=Morganella morganii TaxID=582 RepID=UPI001954CD35